MIYTKKFLTMILVLLFITLIPFICFSQVERVKIEKVGAWDTPSYYFDFDQGNYAYRAEGEEGIAIFEIHDKNNPVRIGNYPLEGNTTRIQLAGHYAYVSTDNKLHILDISKPEAPVLKGTYISKINIRDFTVAGNTAYLSCGIQYSGMPDIFLMVDVSNPDNPYEVSVFDGGNPDGDEPGFRADKVVISGHYAFVSAMEALSEFYVSYKVKLYIIDISNPSTPAMIGTYDFGYHESGEILYYNLVVDFAVHGNYVYMVNRALSFMTEYGKGLQVLDVSNPAVPKLISDGGTMVDASHVVVSGNYLYVTGNKRIVIFDISNPSNPVQVGSWESERNLSYSDMRVSGQLIALDVGGGNTTIIDVSNPSNPHIEKSIRLNREISSIIDISGKYAYIGDSWGRMNIVDISNPSHPLLIGMVDKAGKDNVVAGNYVYALYDDNFKIINISDKSAPVECGSCELIGQYMRLYGNYAYIVDGKSFHLVDISKKKAPVQVGSYDCSYEVTQFQVIGNYILCTNKESNALRIIDTSNKTAPVQVGIIEIPGGICNLEFVGNYAAALNSMGLYVIDIANKSKPTLVGSLSMKFDYWASMSISGKYISVTDGFGIRIIDISDPSKPVLKGSCKSIRRFFFQGFSGRNIKLFNNYIGVFNNTGYSSSSGIYLFDISKPSAPLIAGAYTGRIYPYDKIFSQGDYIYLLYSRKLNILKIRSNSAPSIRLIYPNGDEHFMLYGDYGPIDIFWLENELAGDVTIDLDKGGRFFKKIATTPAITGFYSWKIPTSVPSGNDYALKIHQGNFQDFSDFNFTVDNYLETNSRYHLDKNQLLFLSVPDGKPEAQKVSIKKYSGNGASDWTTEISQSWLEVSPGSGTGEKTLEINVKTPGLSIGTYYGRVYVNIPTWGTSSRVELQVILRISKTLPSISLSPNNLTFTVSENEISQPQIVAIDMRDESADWYAEADTSIIHLNPTSGKGNGIIQVSLDAEYLRKHYNDGIITKKIKVKSPFALNSPQEISVVVNKKSHTSAPFGEFSTPLNGAAVNGSIPVTGWTLDDVEVKKVEIFNGVDYIGDAVFVEGARPDVEQAYPDYPNNQRAGWGYLLLTNCLPNGGNGTYTLYAIATDTGMNHVILGSKTITCDNAHAVKPFGAIDTPAQGGIVSGKNFINWGWALTPAPDYIPVDGSTIDIWVDGVKIGHPTYNISREDIATLFPGYVNSNGAGGYYYLDTTGYSNGVHTIQWTVADNTGEASGIGSRYFTVQNNSQTSAVLNNKYSVLGVNSSELIPSGLPMYVKKGFNDKLGPQEVYPDESGIIHIEIEELERIEINLYSKPEPARSSHYAGYLIVGDQLRELPVGTTLDTGRGVFYWQPGPGFFGKYDFIFLLKDAEGRWNKKTVEINIQKKGK